MNESKQVLAKYLAPTEYSLSNLREGIIFCQHYSCYNDPFEFWYHVVEGIPHLEIDPDRYVAALKARGMDRKSPHYEDVRSYFEECEDYQPPFCDLREDMRIACFGSQVDNLLLWSHYADGLRGFCVVFDEELVLDTALKADVYDVVYLDGPPEVDSFVFGIAADQVWYHQQAILGTKAANKDSAGQADIIVGYEHALEDAVTQMRQTWQRAFAAKPADWAYEQERRLLVSTDQSDTCPIKYRFPRNAVMEVVIGERMPCAYRARLLEVLCNHYPDVPIRTSRRSEEEYALTVI